MGFLEKLISAPFPVILLFFGVALGVLALFGKIPLKDYEDRLDATARMITGLFGLAFIVAAFVINAAPKSKIIEDYIAPAVIVIFGLALGVEIVYLQREEARLVSRVEDATRRVLTGFAEVFQRALLMMEACERELYVVNFTLNFGIVHAMNKDVKEAYADLTDHKSVLCVEYDRPFENVGGDLQRFAKAFADKSHTVRYVYVLTTDKEGTRENFLRRLEGGSGYEYIGANVSALEEAISEPKVSLASEETKKGRMDSLAGKKHYFEFRQTKKLPLQLLITGLPDNRIGCLVFLVGTENVGRGKVQGFYTETETLVNVFKDLTRGLMLEGECVMKPISSAEPKAAA